MYGSRIAEARTSGQGVPHSKKGEVYCFRMVDDIPQGHKPQLAATGPFDFSRFRDGVAQFQASDKASFRLGRVRFCLDPTI